MKKKRGPCPEWTQKAIGVIDAAARPCNATIPEDIYNGISATAALADVLEDENDRLKLLMVVMARLWKAGYAAASEPISPNPKEK